MAYKDLRAFLDRLDAEGLLKRIRRPVSIKYEIAAGIRRTSDEKGPALLFENVAGFDVPVVGGLFSDRRKALLALDAKTPQEGIQKFLRGLHHPIPPKLVDTGPCKEVVLTGDQIDLTRFPMPIYCEKDGGQYVTVGLQVSKDPEDGSKNCSIYRVMLHDRNHLGVMSHKFQHLGTQIAKAAAMGVKLPVAIAQGQDPVIAYASQAHVAYGFDELGIAGGINGEPVEVVRCEMVDLEVPAASEIVIEGYILPGVRWDEGPFGEFTGYYGPREPNPVMEVTAITMRRDPLFVAGLTGVPTTDNHVLKIFAQEATLYEKLKKICPEVTAVCFPEWGGVQYVAIVGLKQRYKGQARHLLLSALGDKSRPKWVIVVDVDVDVYNPEMVNWAIITRSQAAEDVIIFDRIVGGPLDPSAPEKHLISVWGIDATRPFGVDFLEVCTVPGAESFRFDD